MSTRGLYVALLGIDGIGKSTLAADLAELSRRAGRPCTTISWRRAIEQPVDGDATRYPVPSMQNLWFEIFRLYYGGATLDGGTRTLPGSYADLNSRGGTEYLHDATVDGLRAAGPFAATWLEVAGNLLLRHETIEGLLDRGHLVVQESFGYKHVVKELLLVERLAPGWVADLEPARSFLRDFFGRALRPDLGIHLAGDPRLALRWRTAALGRSGAFENLAIAGDDEGESFIALQSACAAEFGRFADAHGWLRVAIADAPAAVNRERILAAVRGTLLADWLTG
jgi:thymidylate kinase